MILDRIKFSEEGGIAIVVEHPTTPELGRLSNSRAAVTPAFHPSIREAEAGGFGGVQVHSDPCGKSEASLCHMRPYLEKKEKRNKNYRKLVVLN